MDIKNFSQEYNVRKLEEKDIPVVYSLCTPNVTYYEYCPPFVTEDSIRKDMNALPPKKTKQDKYYVGYFKDNKLIAVMDFIDAYPEPTVAFIGFFMTDVSVHRKGIGSAIVSELCCYLKQLQYKAIRLGWVEGNRQSEGFWHKNGFVETGTRQETGEYTVVVAQRNL